MSAADFHRLAQEAHASAINPFSCCIPTTLGGTNPAEVKVQQVGCGPGVYDVSIVGSTDETKIVVFKYKLATDTTADPVAADMLPATTVAAPLAVVPATAKDRQIIVPAGYRLFVQALFACTVYLTKRFPGHAEGPGSLPLS